MTRLQKAKEIAFGVLQILTAILLLISPTDVYLGMMLLIIGASFLISGIGSVWYYFTMAIQMVGGRISLYKGVILIEMGVIALALTDVSHYYILLYLIVLHAFQGLIRTLRALESKRVGGESYKLNLAHGLVDFALAILCIIFIKQPATAKLIYASGLIYSAVFRIVSAHRKKRFIYIQ